MRQDRDHVNLVRREEDSGNEPEPVSADVEDYASSNQVGMRISRADFRQILPVRFLSYAIPVIKRLNGLFMNLAELDYCSMAYYPHGLCSHNENQNSREKLTERTLRNVNRPEVDF
jgi:hypothetical protein